MLNNLTNLDAINNKSAGKNVLFCILTTSPTHKFCHFTDPHLLSCMVSTSL